MQMNAARGTLIAGLMTSLVALPAWAAAPIVNASIDPARITLGQSARLTLSRLGEDTDPVTLPVVEGLEFRVIEQLRGFEVIHGASMNTTSIVVRVTPQTTGTFIIPGFTPKSQPLVLRVDPDGGPSNASGALSGKMSGSAVRMTADGSAFVRLTVPKDEVYVGESVPIAIEVGVRAGIVTGLNGLPTLTGADFTLNNLSRQPERSERIIDGKPFTLLTWRSVLAAIKPGRFSLEVDTPLTVRVTTRPPRESLLEDQLGDPFMQNFFGATVPKEITVASPTYEVTVLALPAEGRPAAFSGAVGSFAITSDVAPAAAAAGDPLTLRMHVVGSGNFDRVDSRMLEHLDAWKTYPPKYSFKAADALGYKGEKIFEQPVIASKPGAQTLPGLTFSYFDPATRRYETARSAPLAVTIAPSVADAAPPAAPIEADAGASVRPSSAGNQASLKLRPDHPAADAFAGSLVPLYLRPRFLAVPTLLGLVFAGGCLALRRGSSTPHARASARAPRLSKAARRALEQLEAAARDGDAARFLVSARAALLTTVAARRPATPEPIDPLDVDAWFGGDSRDIRRLFALADEARYSGRQPAAIDFAHWTDVVRRRLLGHPPIGEKAP